MGTIITPAETFCCRVVSFSSPVLVSCEINLVLTLEHTQKKKASLDGSKLSSCFLWLISKKKSDQPVWFTGICKATVLLYKGGKHRVSRCRLSYRSYSFRLLCDKDLVYKCSFVSFKKLCFHFTLCATTAQVH